MGIKKSVCKFVGESLLKKELYEYKKDIKEELEKIYKDEIIYLKTSIKEKQNQIDELIELSKDINKENKEVIQVVETKSKKDKKEKKEEKRFDFPRNMLE